MGRLRCAPVLVVVPLLAACTATVRGPTDSEPPRPGHVAPDGWHSIGFHGISVDVPDDVTLATGPGCSGLPTSGDLVVPGFDAGPSSCPAVTATTPPPPTRPDTVLTVALTATGVPVSFPLPSARTRTVADPGVTVSAAGPAATVDTVLASVRVTPRDDLGCDARVDPAVAPRPLDPDSTALLPVATRAIVVCEYGRTDAGDEPSPWWSVASRALSDEDAGVVDHRLRTAARATSGSAVTAAPYGPVLRLLVRGADGNTRVLQAVQSPYPPLVTDGHLTVDASTGAGGAFPPLPSPFDGP